MKSHNLPIWYRLFHRWTISSTWWTKHSSTLELGLRLLKEITQMTWEPQQQMIQVQGIRTELEAPRCRERVMPHNLATDFQAARFHSRITNITRYSREVLLLNHQMLTCILRGNNSISTTKMHSRHTITHHRVSRMQGSRLKGELELHHRTKYI